MMRAKIVVNAGAYEKRDGWYLVNDIGSDDQAGNTRSIQPTAFAESRRKQKAAPRRTRRSNDKVFATTVVVGR